MKTKTIFITGCSTGIGYETAITLSKRGHYVIASCRKQEDVTKLANLGIETLQMDVNDSHSIIKAFNTLLIKTDGRLDILINNAGFGQAGALEDISREVLRNQFETNVFGLMEITRLAIPIMRRNGHGRIINMSSVLGIISLPFRGAYNASKYAVEGLSDTLRLELKPSGIDVITVQPGPIISHFRETSIEAVLQAVDIQKSSFKSQYQYMLNHFKQQKNASIFTCYPDAVIKKLIHAIESKKPKAKYPVTFPAHFFSVMKRILSVNLLDRLLLAISKKEMSSNK